jgi:hypothetical protein
VDEGGALVPITVEKLICAKCGTEHDSLPPVKSGVWNGVVQTGVWAKDFTYYRDNYLSKGYVVLCNVHKIEDISPNVEGSTFVNGL